MRFSPPGCQRLPTRLHGDGTALSAMCWQKHHLSRLLAAAQVKEKKAAHAALVKERLLLEKKMGKKRSEADKKVCAGSPGFRASGL